MLATELSRSPWIRQQFRGHKPIAQAEMGRRKPRNLVSVLHPCYTNTAPLSHKWRLQYQIRIQKLVGGPGFEPGASRSRTAVAPSSGRAMRVHLSSPRPRASVRPGPLRDA
jgi:hypothetical protein